MCIDCQCRAFSHESNIMSFCSGGWKCMASEKQKEHCLEKDLKVGEGCCNCKYFERRNDYEEENFKIIG